GDEDRAAQVRAGGDAAPRPAAVVGAEELLREVAQVTDLWRREAQRRGVQSGRARHPSPVAPVVARADEEVARPAAWQLSHSDGPDHVRADPDELRVEQVDRGD